MQIPSGSIRSATTYLLKINKRFRTNLEML